MDSESQAIQHASRKESEMITMDPQEAKQIAEEAYIFAFSMLENYKTMYAFSVNKDLPRRSLQLQRCKRW